LLEYQHFLQHCSLFKIPTKLFWYFPVWFLIKNLIAFYPPFMLSCMLSRPFCSNVSLYLHHFLYFNFKFYATLTTSVITLLHCLSFPLLSFHQGRLFLHLPSSILTRYFLPSNPLLLFAPWWSIWSHPISVDFVFCCLIYIEQRCQSAFRFVSSSFHIIYISCKHFVDGTEDF